MRAWSLPLGRWFGVHLRIHYFFLLLLFFCELSTNLAGIAWWRGGFQTTLIGGLAAAAAFAIARLFR